MLSTKALAWLERAMIRKVFFLAPSGLVESALPLSGDAFHAKGYSEQLLQEKIEASRYFASANVSRTILHLPIVVMFYLAPDWWWKLAGAMFTVFCLWHLLLVFLEIYKSGIMHRIPADPDAKGVPGETYVPTPWGDNYFTPRKWESERFYERLGIIPFQKFTLWYIYVARLTRQERKQGKQIEFVKHKSFSELARFENGTRIGEMVHSYFVGFDLIPVLYALLLHHPGWIAYTLFILWGDSWLVLLQRYHRVRIWKTFVRIRDREARRLARNEESEPNPVPIQ